MKFLCLCCYAEVPVGAVYCPNCLTSLLKPSDYDFGEEVNDNGNYRSSGS